QRDARVARREGWEQGPLAPRRSANETHGCVSMGRLGGRRVMGPEELEARAAWAGGMRHLNIAVGDRVVVLEGPYRGKISEITEIIRDRAEVRLDKLVKVRVVLPLV